MSRKPIFDAIRTARSFKGFTPDEVTKIDALLETLGIPGAEQADTGLAKAVESIKRWEGCRLTAYPDPGSGGVPWTIGYGSTRDEQGRAIVPGATWTQERAEARLATEVAEFAKGVDKLIGAAPTTPGQRAALVSIAYNIGLGALKESTLLRLHKEGDYAGAEGQFGRWNKAAGKVMQGLTNRRAAESAIYGGRA